MALLSHIWAMTGLTSLGFGTDNTVKWGSANPRLNPLLTRRRVPPLDAAFSIGVLR